MEDASRERRLFLESVCCDFFRFRHLDAGVAPENIKIGQEVALGPGAFADIEIRAGGAPAYFVEIDVGYSRGRLLESVRRKYGKPNPATDGASRIVVVINEDGRDRPAVERALREALRPELALEVWDERPVLHLLGERFGVALDTLGEDDLLALPGRHRPRQGCVGVRRWLSQRSSPGHPPLAPRLLARSPTP